MKQVLLDIIIVNFFSVKKIQALLDSIRHADFSYDQLHIIVVSNSSEEELQLLQNYPGITLVKNKTNTGFGKACNEGLKHCSGKYVLLLNPDKLVLKNTFSASVQFMETHPDITVLGVKHINTEGTGISSTSTFPRLKNYLNDILGLSKLFPARFKGASLESGHTTTESRYVDHVMGAYLLIRKEYLDKYGFMDPRYFVFIEDVDFCKQVWQNNCKIYYAADISIIHEGSASTDNISSKRLCYSFESKLKYAYKHFSRIEYYILLLVKIFIEPFTRLLFAAARGNFPQVKETVNAYILFWKRRQFR